MEQVGVYLAGFVLGLGIIFPVGPMNLFLIGQGLQVGMPRAWPAVVAVGLQNTALIVIGAIAGTLAADALNSIRPLLQVVGAAYLAWLGFRYLRSSRPSLDPASGHSYTLRQVVLVSIGVVWLNPHALLDAFGVFATAIGTRSDDVRLAFALGIISACWVWYTMLVVGAGAMRTRLTVRTATVIDQGAGVLLLVFSGMFLVESVAG